MEKHTNRKFGCSIWTSVLLGFFTHSCWDWWFILLLLILDRLVIKIKIIQIQNSLDVFKTNKCLRNLLFEIWNIFIYGKHFWIPSQFPTLLLIRLLNFCVWKTYLIIFLSIAATWSRLVLSLKQFMKNVESYIKIIQLIFDTQSTTLCHYTHLEFRAAKNKSFFVIFYLFQAVFSEKVWYN